MGMICGWKNKKKPIGNMWFFRLSHIQGDFFYYLFARNPKGAIVDMWFILWVLCSSIVLSFRKFSNSVLILTAKICKSIWPILHAIGHGVCTLRWLSCPPRWMLSSAEYSGGEGMHGIKSRLSTPAKTSISGSWKSVIWTGVIKLYLYQF